ncbi:MATE family efflux transporter [Hoeflea olei]|uniref:Multidrug export protein MepA n=1 Tax=Hoeflea olei TaxID=1480615 RepID=A0A1C1YYW0_9HYPH|nr:MATE family efflux transporter [Hoeflea olei]OCW58596.1 hypothetical protein AWJ14_05485 [Hoeflea olei]
MSGVSSPNIYLSGSLPRLFVRTATPIIAVMGVSGLFTVVDAWFLGAYVGAEALTAVTLMFPLYMLLVALSTLVSNGFASIYARFLGGGEREQARTVHLQAMQLALVVSVALMALFLAFGQRLSLMAANGEAGLAALGDRYISILVFCSPVVFVLAIATAALRSEGLLAALTAISLLTTLLNIGFDYLFIVRFGAGVAGSAWGTVLAQVLALAVVGLHRRRHKHAGPAGAGFWCGANHWRTLIALGLPSSLGYIGLSLSAGLTLVCLQIWAGESYATTAGAYGIITRLMTFTFLPLLGLSMAFQTIAGNNFGARLGARTDQATRLAVLLALGYCAAVELTLLLARDRIGFVFVEDPAIAADIGRILPYAVIAMVLLGPLMMIGAYFQAIGDPGRAALLGLSRTYLFALPLTALLPFLFGEPGIWYAGAVAELLMLGLTVAVLSQRRISTGRAWGLFETRAGA